MHGAQAVSAGKGAATTSARLAWFGMGLRYSLGMGKQADMVDKAIAAALDKNLRTGDIKSEGSKVVNTAEMGDAILAELEAM